MNIAKYDDRNNTYTNCSAYGEKIKDLENLRTSKNKYRQQWNGT